jgi:hypothetical protein
MPPTEEVFPEDGGLAIDYEAGGAYATVEGQGALTVTLDDNDPHKLQINEARLYELTSHERHERHRLTMDPSPGLQIRSVSFAAGIP